MTTIRGSVLAALLFPVLLFPALCPASEALAPLLACRALQDPAARLACFDRESAHLGAPPAPPSASKDNFGLSEAAVAEKEVVAGMRPRELSNIDAHLTAVSHTGTGLATFSLDNGEVWRQIEPDGDLLAKAGDRVTVSRGMFGSYWLQLKSGRGCKVTRIL